MDTQQVEQATFASDDTPRNRGYHIVARSPGIDDCVARELVRWSPSQCGREQETGRIQRLTYFPVDESRVAIGRTTFGEPEFSGRGGFQAVTSYLVTTRRHLQGFQNNSWAFMLLGRSQGWLRDRGRAQSTLPSLQVTASWLFGQLDREREVIGDVQKQLASEALDYLKAGKRVAILDADDPEFLIRWLLDQITVDRRADISFSIGLQPSMQRPFLVQFVDDLDVGTRSDLSRDGVALVRPKLAVESRLAWDRYE